MSWALACHELEKALERSKMVEALLQLGALVPELTNLIRLAQISRTKRLKKGNQCLVAILRALVLFEFALENVLRREAMH